VVVSKDKRVQLSELYDAVDAARVSNLDRLREFVRQPSISSDGTGMAETASMVLSFVREIGGVARLVETPGYPVVVGELNVGAPRTLLIYGMYDVQPVDGETWQVDPFGGHVVDLPGIGPSVVSRGIFNTKGPLRGFFNAVETMLHFESLPVNLKFLIEGEEENGSKHLPDVVRQCRDELAADAVYFPFYALNRAQKPVVYLGVKGMLYLELSTSGDDQGGPTSRDIHSSYAAWMSSPVWNLLHALTSMVARSEVITIDGFYDLIRGPSVEDLELLGAVESQFDSAAILKDSDVRRFRQALDGSDLLRSYLFSPTINVDGIVAGYTGPGQKTVLPHRISAKVDVRLAAGMTVDDTLTKVQAHLRKLGYSIALEVISGCEPARTSVREEVVQALLRAYRSFDLEPEVWPYIGGTAPFYLFADELGQPFVTGGLGHGGRAHSSDEYAVLETFPLFEKSVVRFLNEFADAD
jgi:acetylornithine deacetylase/succinyl-diaminopimelate desuccinylase-like protein